MKANISGADRAVHKCAPDEVITVEEAREKLPPLTPPVWIVGRPKPDWQRIALN